MTMANMKESKAKTTVDEVRESIDELAHRAGITPNRAFAAWYAVQFYDIDEDDALEAASVDGGEDQGIDLLYVDHINERILLIQAHMPEKITKATPKPKFDALLGATTSVADPISFERAGRADLALVAQETNKHLDSYEAIAMLISLGAPSDQIVRSVATVNRTGKFSPWRLAYQSAKEITEEYESLKLSDDGVSEDTLTFEHGKYFEDDGEYGHAYIGSVSASELSRLYEGYREKLFARNVRLFLGTRKGGINEQIVTTAKETPGRFWALNNGITIVADTIRAEKKGCFRLSRFSIVNGCQTTVSLARAGAPSAAKVLTRLVAANSSVVSDVVRFNNTQNAIRIWTVRASDAIQQRLRRSFELQGIEYAPKPSFRRPRAHDAEFIELDKLAQYSAAAGDTLIEAVREKSELFDRHYSDIFPHDVRPEDVYLNWLIGTLADEKRQLKLAALKETDNPDKTLLALLGVAGTYWTVHCAYQLIERFNPKPRRIGLDGMQTPEFKAAVAKYVLEGLELYHNFAIDSFSDEYMSVRQALRSPKFLKKIDQKLAMRVASLSVKGKFPSLEAAAKSAVKAKKASG